MESLWTQLQLAHIHFLFLHSASQPAHSNHLGSQWVCWLNRVIKITPPVATGCQLHIWHMRNKVQGKLTHKVTPGEVEKSIYLPKDPKVWHGVASMETFADAKMLAGQTQNVALGRQTPQNPHQTAPDTMLKRKVEAFSYQGMGHLKISASGWKPTNCWTGNASSLLSISMLYQPAM